MSLMICGLGADRLPSQSILSIVTIEEEVGAVPPSGQSEVHINPQLWNKHGQDEAYA